jgi:SAM-dependent methyltransferase
MKSGAGVSSTPQRLSKMKRLVWLAPIAVTIVVGCEGLTKLDYTSLGRGGWQRPDDVVAALALRPGDRVADLGAGEGYFIPYLSDAVGSGGSVYAVDLDPEIVAELEAEFAGDAGDNVEVVLASEDDPKLPIGTIDAVLIVNTYHHIADRPRYFAKLRNNLRPGGRIAVIEPNANLGGVLALALEDGHTSHASEIVREMREAGYRQVESLDFLPVQIFEVFSPADG